MLAGGSARDIERGPGRVAPRAPHLRAARARPTARSATTTRRSTAARTACPTACPTRAFTGFYRIEYGLWHGQSARQLTGPAATLDSDVRALRRFWPGMEVDLLDIGPAHPRDPGERAGVPADAGTTTTAAGPRWPPPRPTSPARRELLSHPAPAAGRRATRACPRPTPGWTGCNACSPRPRRRAGSWTPVSQLAVSSRGADRRGRRPGPRGTSPDRRHHRTAEVTDD